MGGCDLVSSRSDKRPMKGLCEHCNASSDSIKCRKSLDYLDKYQVVRSDSTARRELITGVIN
jgi:hypothetical protein